MIGQRHTERGTTLVIVLFLACAIAALAAMSAGRVVAASGLQGVLESETMAFHDAYSQLQMALNVVNSSAYNEDNRNLELLDAIEGQYGGTAAGTPDDSVEWLLDPEDIVHGKVRGTDVRVYRGSDYIQRLAKLRGETPSPVDPEARSRSYYVLEAAGRAGDTVRLVSALVRENEPFSSFVFFQNQHTLGISGAPRGLIHSNDTVAFYFPNGDYVDAVSAVNGFQYAAGADEGNTNVRSGNPEAQPINLEAVDFEQLRDKANLFAGTPGLDAEITLRADGHALVEQYTPPHYEDVVHSWTGDVLTGWETRTVTEQQQVQVGTVAEERTRQVRTGTTTETYFVDVPVYEDQVVTRHVLTPIYVDMQVERSRQVPVYETQTVTRTRRVQVFQPYATADGGTAIGGAGGVPGEWVWVDEEYQTTEQVVVGYTTERYIETITVRNGTLSEWVDEIVQVQVGTRQEERTRTVPVYETQTYTVDVPVYETQAVDVQRTFPVYEVRTFTWTEREFMPPSLVDSNDLTLDAGANTMFVDGRITKLSGDLQGRLTIVGNEKVRVTGSLRYVDGEGDTAMLNGDDYTRPYQRNADYDGRSVLGVIARDDIVFTRDMPAQAEINGTLLSAQGRVGIDGFAIQTDGEPTKNWTYDLSPAQQETEDAYGRTSYRTRRFRKDSLRRMGGLISNERILETYIRPGPDGTSVVDAGFRRGVMKYDTNLVFNPPPNFVEVPRPVVTSVAPVYLTRGED